MALGILGQKVGMTQIFSPSGEVIPVTVLHAGPCRILQVKGVDKDGYEAVQVGFRDKPRRLASRSESGHVAKLSSKRQKSRSAAGIAALPKADCEPQRFIREFRCPVEGVEVGQVLTVAILEGVLNVDVTATSKGRGYSGAMKRHNFSGQRATHGVKKCHRHIGGTGSSAFPSRTFKGKRMAGQYGNARCTVRNQRIVKVDAENNLLLIRGQVPGPAGGYVTIQPTNRLPAPRLPIPQATKKRKR